MTHAYEEQCDAKERIKIILEERNDNWSNMFYTKEIHICFSYSDLLDLYTSARAETQQKFTYTTEDNNILGHRFFDYNSTAKELRTKIVDIDETYSIKFMTLKALLSWKKADIYVDSFIEKSYDNFGKEYIKYIISNIREVENDEIEANDVLKSQKEARQNLRARKIFNRNRK